MTPLERFAEKRARLVERFALGGPGVRLAKDTSNLFRDREASEGQRLEVRELDAVLEVDPGAGWVDAEGMTPYSALVDATLARGVMPAVVPELKAITIGGAVAGVGIEATSFRQGLVHENLSELEVLVGNGSVILCTPDNAHSDLFHGFPNSYGTLGYALRVRARTIPIRPYVRVERLRLSDAETFFAELARQCAGDADFIDGVVFARDELYINAGRFIEQAPETSEYGLKRIYYRSIRDEAVDYLTARDYLWRWDTDWFWCSKNIGAQNPLIRRLLGPKRLNSVFYAKVMRWNARWGFTRLAERLTGSQAESVIQDVDIPIARAPEFLEFFHREIGILPIWICPTRPRDPAARFDLFPLDPQTLYINFGFWDRVRAPKAHPPHYFNRLIERKVAELGGIKSLYSASCFDPEEFWSIYGGEAYWRLKKKYDPEGRFKDLYQKCVLRQ